MNIFTNLIEDVAPEVNYQLKDLASQLNSKFLKVSAVKINEIKIQILESILLANATGKTTPEPICEVLQSLLALRSLSSRTNLPMLYPKFESDCYAEISELFNKLVKFELSYYKTNSALVYSVVISLCFLHRRVVKSIKSGTLIEKSLVKEYEVVNLEGIHRPVHHGLRNYRFKGQAVISMLSRVSGLTSDIKSFDLKACNLTFTPVLADVLDQFFNQTSSTVEVPNFFAPEKVILDGVEDDDTEDDDDCEKVRCKVSDNTTETWDEDEDDSDEDDSDEDDSDEPIADIADEPKGKDSAGLSVQEQHFSRAKVLLENVLDMYFDDEDLARYKNVSTLISIFYLNKSLEKFEKNKQILDTESKQAKFFERLRLLDRCAKTDWLNFSLKDAKIIFGKDASVMHKLCVKSRNNKGFEFPGKGNRVSLTRQKFITWVASLIK